MSASSQWNLDSLEAWRHQGEWLDVDGNQIFTIEAGDPNNATILMVHGFPTSSWDFMGMWEDLAKDYHLVAMDMLGFGFSDKPKRRDYTIHQQADVVEAVIAAKCLGDYHVLAHDYGDTVAQELAARQQGGTGIGQWLSGCYLNGGLFPETHHALPVQRLLLSPIGPLLNRFSGFAQFSKSFSRVFGVDNKPGEPELRALWSLINEKGGKHIFHNLITYMRDRKIHRERWLQVLRDSPVPLALINGSYDPVSGAHMVARYKELGCRLDYLAELEPLGHYPQMEDPAAVSSHYRRFLESIDC